MKKTILGIALLLTVGALVAFSNLKITSKPAANLPADKETTTLNAEFKQFLRQFPESSLPYTISAEQMLNHLNAAIKAEQNVGDSEYAAVGKSRVRLQDDGNFLEGTRRAMFSRSPSYNEPVAQFETTGHYALVYRETDAFSLGNQAFYVAVFDKTGKRISESLLAFIGISVIQSCSIDADLNATFRTHKINWKLDYDEHGPENNEITGLTLESAETLDLTLPQAEEEVEHALGDTEETKI